MRKSFSLTKHFPHHPLTVFLAIVALVTLGRFGFPRLSRVRFRGVLFLVVELVDLMLMSVKSLSIRGEVGGTRKLKQTTANIIISKRVRRLTVANDIVHARGRRHEKVACFGFIGL